MAFERSWHAHYDTDVPGEIVIEPVTLPEILARTAQRFGERTALNFLGKRIVYRELEGTVNRVARALTALGVRPGERVAMLLPNMPQLVAANFGAMKIGALPALFDPLEEDEVLLERVRASGATTLFVLDLLFPRALMLREKAGIRTAIACHISDYLPFPGNKILPLFRGKLYCKIPKGPDTHEFLPLTAAHPEAPLENAARWEEPGALLFTGAADGEGREVLLSHGHLSAAAQQLREWLSETRDGEEGILSVFPLFHPFGFTAMQALPILAGWANILVPRSEPATIIDLTKRYRPTLLPGSPAVFGKLLSNAAFRKLDLTCLKAFIAGGAPVPGRMVRALKAMRDVPVITLYGLTETAAAVAATPWIKAAPAGSVGVPLPNTDLRIVDPRTGEAAPAGERGEILLRGPQVLFPVEGVAAPEGHHHDGWLPTGDVGRIDAEGWLAVTDRLEDRIEIGESTFFPSEVEAVLLTHPKVLEACVAAADGPEGPLVKAFLVLKPYEEGDKREVIAFAQERLPAPKAPRIVEFVGELPRNAMGRIRRGDLLQPTPAGTEQGKAT